MSRLNGAVMQMRGQHYVLETMERGCENQPQTLNRTTPVSELVETVDLHVNQATLSYEALQRLSLSNSITRFPVARFMR